MPQSTALTRETERHPWVGRDWAGTQTVGMVTVLLSITFACGLLIAVAHVLNTGFIAPGYDVVANLTSFACAVAASLLLDHLIPAALSAGAIVCWLWLARRTWLDRKASVDRSVG